MQTQTSATSAYIDMFNMQAGIFSNALEGLSDKNALDRPNDKVNHLNWLLGHLATCRLMLFNLLGGNEKDPYIDLYFKALSTENTYPSLAVVKSCFETATRQLVQKIESISEEEMETEIPGKGGRPKDFISFFVYHEAYHLGQVGYARKFLGLPALKSS